MTNKSELARKMVQLAIADSGLATSEFFARKDSFLASADPGYAAQLKQRALNR